MGIKAAKRLALLGERVDAIQALALGMVTQIVPDDRLEAEVASLTQRLASGPATAMRAAKALLNQAAYPDFDAQLAQEAAHIAECAATDDFRLGVQAVLARQRAQFT